jgi:hypothetical protein
LRAIGQIQFPATSLLPVGGQTFSFETIAAMTFKVEVVTRLQKARPNNYFGFADI